MNGKNNSELPDSALEQVSGGGGGQQIIYTCIRCGYKINKAILCPMCGGPTVANEDPDRVMLTGSESVAWIPIVPGDEKK